jgi:negative regulator of sigma E activity
MRKKRGDPSQEDFLADVREKLDNSAADLDTATLTRLSAVRQEALQRQGPSRAIVFPGWLTLPRPFMAGGLAAAAVLAAMIAFYPGYPNGEETLAAVEDLELLTAEDQLDLYAEMEFYTWLSAERDDAG